MKQNLTSKIELLALVVAIALIAICMPIQAIATAKIDHCSIEVYDRIIFDFCANAIVGMPGGYIIYYWDGDPWIQPHPPNETTPDPTY